MKGLIEWMVLIVWALVLVVPFFLIGMLSPTVAGVLFVFLFVPLIGLWLFWGAAIIHIIFKDAKL